MSDPENKLFTKSLPAFLARTQFGHILERVSKHHDRFLVTKNGEATAVILGVDDFLRAIATTPESLAALQEQARPSGASRLTLDEIEAEIALCVPTPNPLYLEPCGSSTIPMSSSRQP